MKKFFKLLCLLMCIVSLFLLASCMNPIDERRLPGNFPGSTYYCEDYDISFTVYEEEFLINECEGVGDFRSKIMGEMTVDGTKYEFYVGYGGDSGMEFTSKEIAKEGKLNRDQYTSMRKKYTLLTIYCDYRRNGVIVATVTDYEGNILEAGTILTFYRDRER